MGCSPKSKYVKKKLLMRLEGGEANLTELVKASEYHREGHQREKPNRNMVRCYLAEFVRDGVIESEKGGRERVFRLKKSK